MKIPKSNATHFFSHLINQFVNLEKLPKKYLIAELLAVRKAYQALFYICMNSRAHQYKTTKETLWNEFTTKRKKKTPIIEKPIVE